MYKNFSFRTRRTLKQWIIPLTHWKPLHISYMSKVQAFCPYYKGYDIYNIVVIQSIPNVYQIGSQTVYHQWTWNINRFMVLFSRNKIVQKIKKTSGKSSEVHKISKEIFEGPREEDLYAEWFVIFCKCRNILILWPLVPTA